MLLEGVLVHGFFAVVDQGHMAFGVDTSIAVILAAVVYESEVLMVLHLLFVQSPDLLFLWICWCSRVDGVHRESFAAMCMDHIAFHMPVLRTDSAADGVILAAHTMDKGRDGRSEGKEWEGDEEE